MPEITAETFRPHVDSTFTIAHPEAPDAPIEARLLEVESVEATAGRPSSFSLLFGGDDRHLPQAVCNLTHSELGEFSCFLVPSGQREGQIRYEAVFA